MGTDQKRLACRTSAKPLRCRFIVMALVVAPPFFSGNAPADDLPSREQLIAHFRHQERLVESCYAEFSNEYRTTTPENAARLVAAIGKDKVPRRETADIRREHKTWTFWRRGRLQRTEWRWRDPELAKFGAQIEAFDGYIVRRMGRLESGKLSGVISTSENADWPLSPRDDPVAFVWNFYEIPLSRMIETARSVSIAPAPGSDGIVVTLDGAGSRQDYALVLQCDARLRVTERTVILVLPDGKQVPRYTLSLSDYRPHPTTAGETIWFPHTIVREHYFIQSMGRIPASQNEFRFSRVEFNIDMRHEVFTPEFPREAQVYDQVTKSGWLEPGQRPAHIFPEVARARRYRGWVAAAVLSVLAVVLIVAYAARRPRRTPR